MTTMLMELIGVNGQLEVYEDKIIIKRKGLKSKFIQGFFKGDKTIYINQITGIDFKEATSVWGGYIQFTLPGGKESVRGMYGKNGASEDENSVTFIRKQNDLAKEIRDFIEKRILSSSKLIEPSQPTYVSPDKDPNILRKYKQLWDDGIITKDEFETKKKEILGL